MKRPLFITIHLCLILIVLSMNFINDPQNNLNDNKISPTYPATIYPLSDKEFITLQAEFDSLKGNIVAELDNYGLIDYA